MYALLIGVKGNEESRRNYQLQWRQEREDCAKAEFAFTLSL